MPSRGLLRLWAPFQEACCRCRREIAPPMHSDHQPTRPFQTTTDLLGSIDHTARVCLEGAARCDIVQVQDAQERNPFALQMYIGKF